MATITTNYGLIKPELSDAADITAMNENWDKIDAELKKLAYTYGTEDIQVGSASTQPEGTLHFVIE